MFASDGSQTPARKRALVASLLATVLLAFAAQVNAQRVLPVDDPYCGPGGQFAPLSAPCENVSLSMGGNNTFSLPNVFDWVLLELRQGASPAEAAAGGVTDQGVTITLARKPALLLNTGRLVDAEAFVALDSPNVTLAACVGVGDSETNCPTVSFDQSAFLNGEIPRSLSNVFVVVRHRYHLAVMSAQGVSLDKDGGAFDFSNAPADSYQTGTIRVGDNNTPAMIMGDANQNGEVRADDIDTSVLPEALKSGALPNAQNFRNSNIQPHLDQ